MDGGEGLLVFPDARTRHVDDLCGS